jgi:hypothetical protein
MAEGRALTVSYTPMFYAVAALTGGLALAAVLVRVPAGDFAGVVTSPMLATMAATQES